MADHRITLRPSTDDDSGLVFQIKKAAMRDYIEETWGWDEEFQLRFHENDFTPLKYRIIECNGDTAGVLAVSRHVDDLRVNEIMLLPPFQRLGIGTALLSGVLADARANGLPVRLQVIKTNPARRLYERLGFEVTGETSTHYTMACPAE